MKQLLEFLEQLLLGSEDHPDGGPMHFDGPLYTFTENNSSVNAYYYTYNLAYQRPSGTDLHDLGAYDKSRYLPPAVELR